jgi:hypothetical protein
MYKNEHHRLNDLTETGSNRLSLCLDSNRCAIFTFYIKYLHKWSTSSCNFTTRPFSPIVRQTYVSVRNNDWTFVFIVKPSSFPIFVLYLENILTFSLKYQTIEKNVGFKDKYIPLSEMSHPNQTQRSLIFPMEDLCNIKCGVIFTPSTRRVLEFNTVWHYNVP